MGRRGKRVLRKHIPADVAQRHVANMANIVNTAKLRSAENSTDWCEDFCIFIYAFMSAVAVVVTFLAFLYWVGAFAGLDPNICSSISDAVDVKGPDGLYIKKIDVHGRRRSCKHLPFVVVNGPRGKNRNTPTTTAINDTIHMPLSGRIHEYVVGWDGDNRFAGVCVVWQTSSSSKDVMFTFHAYDIHTNRTIAVTDSLAPLSPYFVAFPEVRVYVDLVTWRDDLRVNIAIGTREPQTFFLDLDKFEPFLPCG